MTYDFRTRTIAAWAILASAILVTGCGGSSDSGTASRFDETGISFSIRGTDVQCNGTIVERGVAGNGKQFARCTWACGINGPRMTTRHFYVRNWQRKDSSSAWVFVGDRVDEAICR